MNNGRQLDLLDPIDEEGVGMKNQNVPNSQMSIPKKQRLNPDSGNRGDDMEYEGGKSRSSKNMCPKLVNRRNAIVVTAATAVAHLGNNIFR